MPADHPDPRFAEESVLEALADTPVVLVDGPRQCGKTTLARVAGRKRGSARRLTPEYVVKVSSALRRKWSNGKRYYDYDDQQPRLRGLAAARPSGAAPSCSVPCVSAVR